MMTRPIRISLLLLTLGLAACSASAPVRHYTLLNPPGDVQPPRAPVRFVVEVLPVTLPEYLNQPQLVVRQDDSGMLAVLDDERWLGPLDEEIRNALSAQLLDRLGIQNVAGLSWPSDGQVIRVKLQVRRFDAWPGKRVLLEAGWSLGDAREPGEAKLVCHGRFEEPAAAGYPALVQAQQRLVAVLAQQIGQDATMWSASRKATCGPSQAS
ncbi:PqiC family protein [Achromobacter seleniivolatilans]|uniref:PqiC family protein n=1 Tax=Achromobacter seleniivolatilans TaxID=3047478 RepID=A0ABY9M4S4_9BURK|nr:PqiC family protein [Achromobacter sp. R39]WMD21705.1 PqiC family protein [Achromobacter sp. R39]